MKLDHEQQLSAQRADVFSDKGSTRQIQFPIFRIDAGDQIMTLWSKRQMLLSLCLFFFFPKVIMLEVVDPFPDKAGESTHRSRSGGEKGLK